jgi:hypothetical protein
MKLLLISLLIPLAIGCLSPSRLRAQEFRNAEVYSEWLMTYQENPEPAKLYPAFAFGATNRAIARAGGRKPMVAFFGAVLRADSSLLPAFYERVAQAHPANVHYGFISVLWMANTPASRRYLEQYLRSERAQKITGLAAEGRALLSTPAFDIYRDPIRLPDQLDMLWADFFATGNPTDVARIASALTSDIELASAARWSLTSNGVRSPTVRRLIQVAAKDSISPAVRAQLERIENDINNEAPKH